MATIAERRGGRESPVKGKASYAKRGSPTKSKIISKQQQQQKKRQSDEGVKRQQHQMRRKSSENLMFYPTEEDFLMDYSSEDSEFL